MKEKSLFLTSLTSTKTMCVAFQHFSTQNDLLIHSNAFIIHSISLIEGEFRNIPANRVSR